MMTWYHPVLEPGLSQIVLLCTVKKVQEDEKLYGNTRWKVSLQINERIHVAEHFKERLNGVTILESGDFRERQVGDRLVVFAGGPEYEGGDFLLPCWAGTESDLGILLYAPSHNNVSANDRLLEQLRAAAKSSANPADDPDFMEVFADFCPSGVAAHFIRELRMNQHQLEEEAALQKATKISTPSLAVAMVVGLAVLIITAACWKLRQRKTASLI